MLYVHRITRTNANSLSFNVIVNYRRRTTVQHRGLSNLRRRVFYSSYNTRPTLVEHRTKLLYTRKTHVFNQRFMRLPKLYSVSLQRAEHNFTR